LNKILYKHIYNIYVYMDIHIDKLRSELDNISKQEYEKHGYIPDKISAKELKSKIKEKEAEIEMNKVKGKLGKIIQKKEQKKGIVPSEIDKEESQKFESNYMDNTSDTFNVIEDDKEYPEWRKLPIEDRLTILENFFESDNKHGQPYDDEIKAELKEMVEENKVLYKKDILFDKINGKILDIPLVKYQKGQFILKTEEKKVNVKKQNINSINKLLKRK